MRHSHWPTLVILLLALLTCALQGQTSAQPSKSGEPAPSLTQPQTLSLQNRPGLLDGPGSPLEALPQHGVDLAVTSTEFGQALVVG